MKILAIGAHPDDIEIFMYGCLSACKARGDDIELAVATDGAAGTVLSGSDGLAGQRAKETTKGLADLGVPQLLDLPDGKLAGAAGADVLVAALINSVRPDLIITHAPEDYHPDHRALSKNVTDAAGFICPVLFADTLMGVGFIPDFYIDITPFIEAKMSAIGAHHSQQPEKFADATRLHNRFRAAQCNAPDGHYAEAYRFQPRFPFGDIRALIPPAPPVRAFYEAVSDTLL